MSEGARVREDAGRSAERADRGRRAVRSLRATAVIAASWLACRLPEPPLLALADFAGRIWYRLAPERRRRARRNLTRVVRWLADHDMGGPKVRLAAGDGRALNRLVREAFRHAARYYVQLARAPIVDGAYLDRWLVVETPEILDATLSGDRAPGEMGALFVGLHMGWFELPAVLAAARTGRPALVPSETIADPHLQAYLVETRSRLGLELIGLAEAKRMLRAALLRGETVGLLGDRDITGGGVDTEFFGAPSPLAAGPALLAMDTGITPYVFGVWRDEVGVYHVSAEPVPFPAEGTRRERVTAYLDAEARAFERHIAAAPEQWLAIFHPLWPDLEPAPAHAARKAGGTTVTAEPRGAVAEPVVEAVR
ncbi:MAG TPA: lysophospholipid acyltransferase family protein [Candidatus Limnocylindria bacterium]|nr:lysophospholipid acyltransferase family protein [Candidatus Limnocylindria bacterium]